MRTIKLLLLLLCVALLLSACRFAVVESGNVRVEVPTPTPEGPPMPEGAAAQESAPTPQGGPVPEA